MRAIIAAALRFRLLVVAAAAVLVFVGARSADRVPMDVFPEFAPPLVEIQTEAPGMSAEEVDALVTVPLEGALAGSAWTKTIRSKSVLGLSSVVLIFNEGVDLLQARQLVQERLANAARSLPAIVHAPVMLSPLSALSRVSKIGVSSSRLSMMELSELVRWRVRPRLLAVPGVANIAVWGERRRQLQVLVDPERLQAEGVSLTRVVQATRSAALTTAGGFLDTPNQRLAIMADTPIKSADDLRAVVLSHADGVSRRLGSVAEVVDGRAPLIGEGIINDGPGLLLIVEKQPWANTLDVTYGVEAALEELRPGLADVDVDPTIFRTATFIEDSLDNLTGALKLGIFLVLLVLAGFLFDWRTAVISVTAIPVSLLAAVLVLEKFGGTINTMILAGLVIALGEVVDDAIIDVENIARRLRQARAAGAPFSRFKVVLEASLEVRSAVVYGSLVVVLVMAPVFMLEGLSGSFFRPLAMSYVLAIGASLVTAMTLTPALSLMLLARGTGSGKTPPLVRGLCAIYRALLRPLLRVPWVAAGVAVLLLVGTGILIPRLGEDFMPRFKERDFLMHWVEKPGTSIEAMARITERVSEELRAIPGVRNFGAHIGRAEVADEVVGPNFTELWISLDPDCDYDETVAKIERVIDGYPGLYRDLLTYLKERIKEVLSGTSASLVVRIKGPDLATLRTQAHSVADALRDIPGLVDLKVEQQTLVPRVRIRLNYEALARHGLDPGTVREAIMTCTRGTVVGEIFDNQAIYDVAVWSLPHVRQDVAALRRILVRSPGGTQVPLDELAFIDVGPTPNVIKREGSSRRIDVTANVKGRDLASVATEVERRVKTQSFPRGYHPEVLGEYAAQREARGRLLSTILIALVGIFLLLQTDFRSFRASVMVFLVLPMALVGGVLGVFATGGILSLGSFVGFVTVLGVAARNSIMLVSHYRTLQVEEGMDFGLALVLRGAEERLAPILMTALTTGLALVPILMGGDLPGHEIEHPMAVVIVGGLATSTLLSLFVLPGLYLMWGRGVVRPDGDEALPATGA